MKKVVILALVLVVILGSTPANPTNASSHEVRIFPVFDNTYELEAGQVGVISFGWAATTVGLTQQYINRTNIEFTLVGTGTNLAVGSAEARAIWSPISEFDFDCNQTQSGAFISRWIYDLGTLAQGTYTLHYLASSTGSFTDGCDSDADGMIDVFPTGFESTITIIQK